MDNTVRYNDYLNGQFTPIARWMIPASWVLLTAAGLVGYRRLTLGQRPIAAALLGAYSASGLVGPVHYTAGPPSDFDAVQNVLIIGGHGPRDRHAGPRDPCGAQASPTSVGLTPTQGRAAVAGLLTLSTHDRDELVPPHGR